LRYSHRRALLSHNRRQKEVASCAGRGSYAGESDHRIPFGLEQATMVDKLEIRWPSGTVQTLENIAANQILKVQEPAASAREVQ
jgi:hypothetical protein